MNQRCRAVTFDAKFGHRWQRSDGGEDSARQNTHILSTRELNPLWDTSPKMKRPTPNSGENLRYILEIELSARHSREQSVKSHRVRVPLAKRALLRQLLVRHGNQMETSSRVQRTTWASPKKARSFSIDTVGVGTIFGVVDVKTTKKHVTTSLLF